MTKNAMNNFARATLLSIAVAACQGNDQGKASEDAIAAIQSRHGCPETASRLPLTPSDSLSRDQNCALVAAALSALSSPSAESGLAKGDSAAVERATVVPMAIEDSVGKNLQRYWSVGLVLRDRTYDAEVHVDRGSGIATARRVHKPIG